MFEQKISDHYSQIDAWLKTLEEHEELPLYSSVDIRDSGFKTSVVDTNLFPAGFNNLCKLAIQKITPKFREIILSRIPNCQSILMIIEEHTRNTWYLENVYTLVTMIKEAGFQVKVASFLEKSPEFCDQFGYTELTSAEGNMVKVYCLKGLLSAVECKKQCFDLIILNNDLTTGVPDILKQACVPIYPSIAAGWYARSKSHHFAEANSLLDEFGKLIDVDPWFFSCLFEKVEAVDINEEEDRQRLYEVAKRLFSEIEVKYQHYGIQEKPFIFLKADAGTYGMGVKAIESPEEILALNRKSRNNLSKGKSAQKISDFILQEGVPSQQSVHSHVGEVCIYQITNHFIGGFYRFNTEKSTRDNLNSSGMKFQKMCLETGKECALANQDCVIEPPPENLLTYQVLARIAALAAHREVKVLEQR